MERFDSKVKATGTIKFMQVKPQPEETVKDGFNTGDKIKIKDFGAFSFEDTYSANGTLTQKKVKVNPIIETEDGVKLYLNQEYSRNLQSKQEFTHINSKDGNKTKTVHPLDKAQDKELIATTWDIMLKANVNVAGNTIKSLIKDDLVNFLISNIANLEGKPVTMFADVTYRPSKDGSKIYDTIDIKEIRDKKDYEHDGISYTVDVLLKEGSVMVNENYDGDKVERYIPLNIGLMTQQKVGDNYVNVIINNKDKFFIDTTICEEDTPQQRVEKMMLMGMLYEVDGEYFDNEKVYKVRLEGNMVSEGEEKKLTLEDLNPLELSLVQKGMMTLEKISQRKLGNSKKTTRIAFQPYFVKQEIEDVEYWSAEVKTNREQTFQAPIGGMPPVPPYAR